MPIDADTAVTCLWAASMPHANLLGSGGDHQDMPIDADTVVTCLWAASTPHANLLGSGRDHYDRNGYHDVLMVASFDCRLAAIVDTWDFVVDHPGMGSVVPRMDHLGMGSVVPRMCSADHLGMGSDDCLGMGNDHHGILHSWHHNGGMGLV